MKVVLLVFVAVFVACQLSWSSTSAISLSHVNDQIQDTGAWVEPMYVEVESEADVVRLRHLAGRKAGGKKAGTSKGGNAKAGNAKAGNAKGGNTKAADAKGGKKEKKKKEKDPVSCTSPIPADKRTKEIKIDPKLVEKAKKETHPKGKTPGKCDKGVALTESAVKEYLVAAWKAFGAVEDATKFADLNIKQVKKESTFCPNIMQGVVDVNTGKDPAGGLFQFTQQTFNTWAVKGFDKNRFNPLSNILAAVNAQVNAECIKPKSHKRVLNGSAGWTPSGGSNPFK